MEGDSRTGEVRKVHVVYFLSRNGDMEQPHLIRVRHRSQGDGIRLRDVKRWLSELRGKGMPDAFAWSYKRRYKTGYVWQDLADDDLITPISDNEYVLKGSLTTTTTVTLAGAASSRSSSSSATIFSSPSAATSVAADCVVTDSARTNPQTADPFPRGRPPGNPRPPETAPAENPDRHDEVSPKPPPPVDEEEEEETADEERREHSGPPPQQSNVLSQITSRGRAAVALGIDVPRLPVSRGSSFEIEEEAQPEDEAGDSEEQGVSTNDSSYSLLPGRRRAHSWCGGAGGRASHVFRNLLGCGVGAAAVDDSALLPVEPRRRGQVGGGKDDTSLSGRPHQDPAGGGASSSGQSRGGVKSSPGSSGGEAVGVQKPAATCSEAYKPAAEPSCSQCGKPFKPERLHAHMKSCRALRNQRKRMSSEKLRTKEAESHRAMLSEEASSLFLLSH